MEFTTDVVTQVLEQLQEQARQEGIVLEDLPEEEQMRFLQQGLQALGAGLAKRLWEAQDQTLHQAGVVCQQEGCVQAGRPMRRTARRTAQVTTIFGTVRFRRGEYQGDCGHRRRPLDEALGLRPGQPDPYLEGLLAELGAQTSFKRGAQWLARWFHVEVSPNTVRRATVAWGERLAQEEQAHDEASAERSARAGAEAGVWRHRWGFCAGADGGERYRRVAGSQTGGVVSRGEAEKGGQRRRNGGRRS